MAVIELDAIDPQGIGPALRDLLLRYARLLAATAADNTLRGRRKASPRSPPPEAVCPTRSKII